MTTAKLADEAVTTGKLDDESVTSAKLGNSSVTARKVAVNAITDAKIADNAVISTKIPSNAILTRHIGANQIEAGNMRAGAVTSGIIADGAVATADVANDAITEAKLASAVRTKLNATPRVLRPVSQFVRNSLAQTVYVQWVPGVVVASGAALTVTVEGVSITGVTAPEGLAAGDTQGIVLPIAITAANAGSIARSSDAIAGHVEIQVRHGGVTDSCFMGTQAAGSDFSIVRITQAAYDALAVKAANTLYLIPE